MPGNPPPPGAQAGPSGATTAAQGELRELEGQDAVMNGLLVRLLQETVQAEARLGRDYAAQLVEVNQQLVLAALASRAEAADAQQALADLARDNAVDALTHLPTRSTLQARFDAAVATAQAAGSRFALLFLDLTGFEALAGSHGHAFGDRLREAIAGRLVAGVEAGDTVSRHGGEEFIVLLVGAGMPARAPATADGLMAAVAAPVTLDGTTVAVTASAGIAIYPDDGESLDALVARADDALHAAKRRAAPSLVAARAELERQNSELRDANERLLLAALTAREMQSAAEQVRERQAAFLGAVARELRDPAAPIRVAAAMLGRAPASAPLLPRVQDIVERQLARMARLLGDVIDADALESGGMPVADAWVDMNAVVATAAGAIQPAMAWRHQQFGLQRPAGALRVRGDATRLVQAGTNLLDNASKFTPDEGRISVAVTTDGATLSVTVTDDGIGITPAMLPRVFEPFVQDTPVLGLNGAGLGIGLTVARKLARAHGGDVVGYSDGLRRGSRFVLTLPLPPPDGAATAGPGGPAGSRGANGAGP
jgi:diguanylate cyclase (GGDEF)-like protein